MNTLSGRRKAGGFTAACLAALAVAGCNKTAATGQVLATVGGKDITLQDVRAEGRADGVSASAGHAADVALLQRVVDRTLLAQSAHAQKLDQTPEAPSDLARLEQGWRADKAARRLLVGVTPPTDSAARSFIAEHPYAFAKRQRVSARTISLAMSPTLLNQLKTYPTYDGALAFLKHLGVALSTGEGQIDTAQLPTPAAEKLVSTPVGTLLTTASSGRIQLAEIQAHTPVTASAEEQLAVAKRSLLADAAQRRITAELTKLKSSTPVTYQAGYAPPKPGASNPSS